MLTLRARFLFSPLLTVLRLLLLLTLLFRLLLRLTLLALRLLLRLRILPATSVFNGCDQVPLAQSRKPFETLGGCNLAQLRQLQ